MRGLAFRRHQEQKAKKKARDKLVNIWNWTPPHGIDEPDARRVGMAAHTPKVCSGPCCGNPRRHFNEIPISEKKLRQSEILH